MDELLSKYLEVNEIKLIKYNLNREKQRTIYINNEYFIKIGKNTDELFFNNLMKEIELYRENKENSNLPKLVDYFISNNICIIIQERINGKTLGNVRNNFNLNLDKSLRLKIANSVLEIANMSLKINLKDDYNTKEKIDKYIIKASSYLDDKIIQQINNNYERIIAENEDKVIAHGDLISTNIILDNEKIYFIDWEFISLKPRYYDLAYFLLFSKEYNSLDILQDLDNINVESVYKEAILICLKEISNNAKLAGKIDNSIIEKNINRWKKELCLLLNDKNVLYSGRK